MVSNKKHQHRERERGRAISCQQEKIEFTFKNLWPIPGSMFIWIVVDCRCCLATRLRFDKVSVSPTIYNILDPAASCWPLLSKRTNRKRTHTHTPEAKNAHTEGGKKKQVQSDEESQLTNRIHKKKGRKKERKIRMNRRRTENKIECQSTALEFGYFSGCRNQRTVANK